MPRDISGNYTLPVGNPVVSGTIIDVDWANPTMSDIAAQLNNVITRDGVLAATNPIKFANGAVGAPSITFNSDPAMGLYRIGTNILGFSTAGTERFRIDASGLFTFAGTGKIPGGTVSVPGLAFTTETNTGLYRPAGANPTIGLAVNGIRAYDITRSAGQVSHSFLGSIGNLSKSVNFTIPDSGDTVVSLDSTVGMSKVSSDVTLFTASTILSVGGNVARLSSTGNDTLRITNQAAGLGSFIQSLNSTLTSDMPLRIGGSGSAIRFGHNVADVFTSRVNGATVAQFGAGGLTLRHAPGHSNWGINATSGAVCNYYSDNGSAAVLAGSITVNGATASYNSASDVRLKTNIADAAPATDLVNRIQVRRFDWKGDGKSVSHGFVAQELDAVFPDAVHQGETWGVDNSKLVPLLTKSLQEAWVVINELRTPPRV